MLKGADFVATSQAYHEDYDVIQRLRRSYAGVRAASPS
jgi:hypothetical protein